MSLSSLIVQREVATMRQVEEALARQVIYGGDFVTNLLEVARVDETAGAQLLAEPLGLPPVGAPAERRLDAPSPGRRADGGRTAAAGERSASAHDLPRLACVRGFGAP